MRKCILFVLPFVLIAVSILSGCGGEDDPVTPTPASSSGTIVLNPDPDSLNAPWTLTGPDSYSNSGTGDESLADLAVGDYTLTWEPVAGWTSPENSTQTLVVDGTITFSGTYSEDPGIVQGYILIPPISVSMPSTFMMGSFVSGDETPHQVTLTNRFNLKETEVTNAQYVAALQWAYGQGHVTVTASYVIDALDDSTEELLEFNPSYGQITFSDGVFSTSYPDRPVVAVSWYGAVAYCDWLSLQAGLPRAYDHDTWSCNNGEPYAASGFRLPTEAEWEFACRAGTTTHFNTGDCLASDSEANYKGTSPYIECQVGPNLGYSTDAGSYSANQWGIFDMHGNVFEWCNDWHDDYAGNQTDPEGPLNATNRITRGGAWNSAATSCRSAFRNSYLPFSLSGYIGFRPVKSAP